MIDMSVLPSGYTEVEYIESSGTQYIDTNIFLTLATKCEVVAEITNMRTDGNVLFGGTTNGVIIHTDPRLSVSCRFQGDGSLSTECTVGGVGKKFTCIVDKNARTIYDASGNILATNETLCDEYGYNCQVSIFGNSGVYDTQGALCARLYSAKIWTHGELTHSFVPCANNVEAGLYDIVNGVFYGNDGTGAFIVPPIKRVNKVVYGTTVLVDLTEDSVTPETLAEGVTAHDKAGNPIVGTMQSGGGGGGDGTPSDTYTVTFTIQDTVPLADYGGIVVTYADAYNKQAFLFIEAPGSYTISVSVDSAIITIADLSYWMMADLDLWWNIDNTFDDEEAEEFGYWLYAEDIYNRRLYLLEMIADKEFKLGDYDFARG